MALNTMNIKVISREIIKPSCPTPNHLRLLQASLFDHVNSPTLMPLIFFFNYQKTSTKISTNEVLDGLKGSLPNTLSMFYPLAGRVQGADYFNCNDEGVPYVLAKVDKRLDNVVHKVEASELDKLLPLYGQKSFISSLLLAVQVNVFACGGIAIGVMMSHAISDAFSLSIFVKTWASVANGNNHNSLLGCPIFEICKLFPPSTTSKVEDMDVYANQERPVTKWFMFSEAKLNALKSILYSYTNTGTLDGNSLTMILLAFIWSRIKVACHKSPKHIPHHVFQAINLRPNLSPPDKHSSYFGNIFVNAIAKLSVIIIDDDNYSNESLMCEYLEKAKESIDKIKINNRFVRNLQEGTQDLRFMLEHFERAFKGETISLGFSNLRSLPIYEVDFGWGKPIWVTSATLMYKNLVVLIPAGPSSNDIVAYINLTAEDMAKLENDPDFTSFLSNKSRHASSKL